MAGSPEFEEKFDQSLEIYKMMRSENKPEYRGRVSYPAHGVVESVSESARS